MRRLQITVEDCGRWFDDYVVSEGKNILQVVATAKEIDPLFLIRWLRVQARRTSITPQNAEGLAHVASEIATCKQTQDDAKRILDVCKLSQAQAKALAKSLLEQVQA